MKKKLSSALLLALSLALLAGAYVRAERNVIRMHVIARSDAAVDQRVKEQVRRALLPLVDAALAETEEPEEALRALLPTLERKAAQLSRLSVTVTLSEESYPARFDSGSFLPAGRYTALRVILGEGRGRNWWGVVYPEEEELPEIRWWIADWWHSFFSREMSSAS